MWTLIREEFPENFESPVFEEVNGRGYKLGRTAEFRCQSPVVSRNHCEIQFQNGAWFIRDLRSLNGTFVNGVRGEANEWMRINHNDKIGLGSADVVAQADLEDDQEQHHFFIFRFINTSTPAPAVAVQNDDEVEILTVPDSDDEVIPEPPTPTPKKVIAESPPKPGPSSLIRSSNCNDHIQAQPNQCTTTKSPVIPVPSQRKITPSKMSCAAAPSNDNRAKLSKPGPASSKKPSIAIPNLENITKNLRAGPASWKKSQEKKEPLKRGAAESRSRVIDESPSKRIKLVADPPRRAKKLPSTSEESDADEDSVHRNRKNGHVFKNKQGTKQGGAQQEANVMLKTRISQSPSSSSTSSSSSLSAIPRQKGRVPHISTPILRWCSGEKMEQMIICLKRVVEVTKDGFQWDPLISKRISIETKKRLERQLGRTKDLEEPACKTSKQNMIGQQPASTSSAPTTSKSLQKSNDDDDLGYSFENDHYHKSTIKAANGSIRQSNSVVQKPSTVDAPTSIGARTGYSPARGPINVPLSAIDLRDSESDTSVESIHSEDNFEIAHDDEPTEHMELQEAEGDEEDRSIETAQPNKGRQEPRKILLLDSAPTPRQYRSKPSNQSGKPYVSKNMAQQQQQQPPKEQSAKDIRREQLRKLTKNKEMQPKNITTTTVPHSTEKPKVKVTSKSRNDGLFADIVGKVPEDQQQPHTSQLMSPVSEELRNQMPMQRIIHAASKITFPDGTKSAPVQNGHTSHASLKQFMQKDSVVPAPTIKDGVLSSTEKSGTFMDKVKTNVPGPFSSCTKHTRSLSRRTNIDTLQPYRDVLNWNAKWLEVKRKKRANEIKRTTTENTLKDFILQ